MTRSGLNQQHCMCLNKSRAIKRALCDKKFREGEFREEFINGMLLFVIWIPKIAKNTHTERPNTQNVPP